MKGAVSMKKLLVLALALVLALSLAGCSKTYKTDYVQKYAKFLDYSLGTDNWSLDNTAVEESEFADFAYYYTEWTVGYKDSSGVRRTLSFNNYTGSTDDDAHFARFIVNAATDITKERLENEIGGRYTENGTDSSLSIDITTFFPIYMPENSQLPLYREVISPTGGLSLYDFDPAWIFRLNRIYLTISGVFHDREHYSHACTSLYPEIRDFFGNDPVIIMDLSLCEAETGNVLESEMMVYIENERIAPAPKEGQSIDAWFEELLREKYFPKEGE